jgi:hypothetical protein
MTHAEMPTIVAEHVEIRAAVAKLEDVARAENNAQALLNEEEVSCPAALLVGDIIRARGEKK